MTDTEDLRMRWSLGSDPSNIAWVRNGARKLLTGWNCPHDAIDAALLVLSELVTNAIVHTAAPEEPGDGPQDRIIVRVTVRADRHGIRIEVGDSSPVHPTPVDSGADDEHGRGLALVAAFSSAWGVKMRPGGGCAKQVWAEIADPTDSTGPGGDAAVGRRPQRTTESADRRPRLPAPPDTAWGDATQSVHRDPARRTRRASCATGRRPRLLRPRPHTTAPLTGAAPTGRTR